MIRIRPCTEPLSRFKSGREYAAHKFVFSDAFRDVLINSGIDADF